MIIRPYDFEYIKHFGFNSNAIFQDLLMSFMTEQDTDVCSAPNYLLFIIICYFIFKLILSFHLIILVYIWSDQFSYRLILFFSQVLTSNKPRLRRYSVAPSSDDVASRDGDKSSSACTVMRVTPVSSLQAQVSTSTPNAQTC